MEFRKASKEDFDQLINLQNENLVSVLSEEQKQDGFLSASFTHEQFAMFNEDLAVIVAVDESGTEADAACVQGFLVTSTAELNLSYPLPAAMIARYPQLKYKAQTLDSFKSFVAGPVCVAKSQRGKGIFQGIYSALPSILPPDYELAVALVSTTNPRSIRAHEKVGMEKIDQFEFGGREFYTLVKTILCLLICCFLSIGVLPSVDAVPIKADKAAVLRKAKIDKLFAHVSPTGPGAMVTISRDGKIVFQKGYGLANPEEKLAFKPDTVFDLASCSKQFTSMAVLILLEQGKVALDDDICKFFPDLRSRATKGRALTVRDLLQMTSGLPDYSEEMSRKELQTKSNADVLQWTAARPRRDPPGKRYQYNNGNYAITAYLVEQISKEPFPKFMKREVFDKLGMNHTSIMTAPGQTFENRAGGYRDAKNRKGFVWARLDTQIFGDGQVMTTPQDFARWDKGLRDSVLVKPETMKQAFTSGKLNNGTATGYGLGFSVGKICGHDVVDHEGNWDGTSTYILHYLKNAYSIIVLSNNEDFNAGEFGNKIGQILFPSALPQKRVKAPRHS